MKEKVNIDELLNGFIDGELSARQLTEVQRLLSHDAKVAERLEELRKCKQLLEGLPCCEAPADMAEQVKASLEQKTGLVYEPAGFSEPAGARHLMVRKVLSAAAMIGLVAVLGVVVYTIVAPETVTDRPIAIDTGDQPRIGIIEAKEGKLSVVATAEEAPGEMSPAKSVLAARLELKTGVLAAVDAKIRRAIEDVGLSGCEGPAIQKNKSVYVLSGSREAVSMVLADLRNIWARLESAQLSMQTEKAGEQIVVNAVTGEQLGEIISEDSTEMRMELAKNFAVLNRTAELLPGRQLLAAVEDTGLDLITIPKPVLTSDDERIAKSATAAEGPVQVRLTIEVVGVEDDNYYNR